MLEFCKPGSKVIYKKIVDITLVALNKTKTGILLRSLFEGSFYTLNKIIPKKVNKLFKLIIP